MRGLLPTGKSGSHQGAAIETKDPHLTHVQPEGRACRSARFKEDDMTKMQFAADAAATPISELRQKAKQISREEDLKLSAALDRVAQETVGMNWDRMVQTSWTLQDQKPQEFAYHEPATILTKAEAGKNLEIEFVPVRGPGEELDDDLIGSPYAFKTRSITAVKHFLFSDGKLTERLCMRFCGNPKEGFEIPPDLADEVDAAETLQGNCSAWIKVHASISNMIPEDHFIYDPKSIVFLGILKARTADQDGHKAGLRLQHFTGADGRKTWRVSFRSGDHGRMHPDLYIPAGQIDGGADPKAIADEIVAVIREGRFIQISKNGFYAPGQAAIPVALPLSSGTVLATIPFVRTNENLTFEGRKAEGRIQAMFEGLREHISAEKLMVEETAHLGVDTPNAGENLEIWQWGGGRDLPMHADDDALSKHDTLRPNARMRFLDHHLLRGLVELVCSMKYPVGDAEKAPSWIRNSVYVWSGGEHTDGSNAEEPFKYDCSLYHADEVDGPNRNARSLFIVEALEKLVSASYIDLPLTIELKQNLALMSGYYRKLAKGKVSNLSMQAA